MGKHQHGQESAAEEPLRRAALHKRRVSQVVELVGASPPEKQVQFLRDLLSSPKQSAEFLDCPEAFAAERGVVIDPELIRAMVDTLVFEEPMGERLVEQLGPDVTADLVELQGDGRVAAIPVAIATAVAVASAAVALVAQATNSMTLRQIKGLTPTRQPAQFVTAVSTVAAAYGTATLTTAAVAAVASVVTTSNADTLMGHSQITHSRPGNRG